MINGLFNISPTTRTVIPYRDRESVGRLSILFILTLTLFGEGKKIKIVHHGMGCGNRHQQIVNYTLFFVHC